MFDFQQDLELLRVLDERPIFSDSMLHRLEDKIVLSIQEERISVSRLQLDYGSIGLSSRGDPVIAPIQCDLLFDSTGKIVEAFTYMCMFIEVNVHSGVAPRLPKQFSLQMPYFALDEEFSVSLASHFSGQAWKMNQQ